MKKNILICCHSKWISNDGTLPLLQNYFDKFHKNSTKHLLHTGLFHQNLDKKIFKGNSYSFFSLIGKAFCSSLFSFSSHIFKVRLTDYVDYLDKQWSSYLNRVKSYFELFFLLFFLTPYLKRFCKNFDEIIVICSYDRLMMSIIYASNLIEKNVFEIQHGIIFDSEIVFGRGVYKNSTKVPLLSPSKYILWDKDFIKGFDKNLTEDRFIFCGDPTNAHNNKSFQISKKINVLLAFDNLYPIPRSIHKLITKNEDINFLLRPHPRTNKLKILYLKLLSLKYKNCQFNSFKNNIYKVISDIDLTIVDCSSVSIISSKMGKKAYYYNEILHKKNKIPNNKLIEYVSKNRISETISQFLEQERKKKLLLNR